MKFYGFSVSFSGKNKIKQRHNNDGGAQHNNSTTHPDAAEGVVGLVEREVGHDVYELLLGKALELFF